MRKRFLFIVVLFYCFSGIAQEAIYEKSSKKEVAVVTLKQIFSAKVLNAYQENSKSKIDDLFAYFQMLTDAKLDNDLKKEVIQNINLLFKNPNETVVDFTSASLDRISLQQFIQKLLISEPVSFSISDEVQYNAVDNQSWKTVYIVTRTQSGTITKTKVIQEVFFYETAKSFGNDTKNVLSMFLGVMN